MLQNGIQKVKKDKRKHHFSIKIATLLKKKYSDRFRLFLKRMNPEYRKFMVQYAKTYRLKVGNTKRREWARNYRIKNRERIRKWFCGYAKAYQKNRYNLDPKYKLERILRSRLQIALKRKKTKKISSGVLLLGCSVEQAREHIEKQFSEGMNWDNWNLYGWHLDHIKPVSSFDLNDIEQQKICFNYKNLQPLWSKDNLAKKNKILL